ncbi:hypothetical protein RRG08_047719 [Elysia crispata]|uniref:Uncharacterized protein n=1 Tax=Elysia crispata TaxID=231223 RepID=A0AAE1A8K7_9GAST|nr:hypothetical protein RRG08_047719 [Elysia crispata]
MTITLLADTEILWIYFVSSEKVSLPNPLYPSKVHLPRSAAGDLSALVWLFINKQDVLGSLLICSDTQVRGFPRIGFLVSQALKRAAEVLTTS